ncbi:MAG TPA: sugar ABC transporter substrate-binding protein, partial [Chloroflexota bacterium]|nr:sugar ABC transporter substrate-binding protein [Chloroflexota bacterium]
MQTRRTLFTTVAALAGAAALAACGAPQGDAGAGAGSKSTAPATLSFATLYKEDPSWNLSKAQLTKFEQKFPHIKVTPDWIPGSTGDYLKKAQTYLAAGQNPDVLYIHYLQTAIFGSQNALLDLSKHAAQDKAFNQGDFVQGVWDHFKYKDKPAGVPWYSGPHTVLFNKSLFQRLGVKDPEALEKEGNWTWETMRDAAQKLTKGSPGSADRSIGFSSIGGLDRLGRWERTVWQNGGELFNKDFTKSQFSSPAAVTALQFFADIYAKDRTVVSADEQRQLVSSGSAFLSGKAGMEYGVARDGMTALVDGAQKAGFNLGLVPLPKGKAGRPNIDGPQAYGVGAATKFPDAAWELVKWYAEETMQAERLELGASVPVRKSMQKHKSFVGALRP